MNNRNNLDTQLINDQLFRQSQLHQEWIDIELEEPNKVNFDEFQE